jgi:hypothetical protein
MAFTTTNRGLVRDPSHGHPGGHALRILGVGPIAGAQSRRRADSNRSRVAPGLGKAVDMDCSQRARGGMGCTIPVLRRSSVPFRPVQFHPILACDFTSS